MAAILTFPETLVPESIDFRLMYVSQAYASPFGSTTQTSEVPGARWNARLNYSNLQVDEQRQLASFLAQLRGMSGRFTMFDFSLPEPQAGSKVAGSVIATNLSPTRTRIELNSVTGLTVGDYIEVTPTPDGLAYANSYKELKMITGITNNVVDVEPPFRVTPAVGDPVVFDKASTVFMLDTDDQAGWSASTSIALSNMTISCMEAF